MTISFSHPTFLIENKVQELCAPFFDQHGFSYFQYARFYADNTAVMLLNNTSLFRQFIDLDYPSFSSFKDEHQNQHSYWFLWDEELPWLPVKMARETHKLHHGVTLLRRSKDHYDMIGFALPEEKRNISSYYLTRLKAMESFIHTFEARAHDLMNFLNQTPFIVNPMNVDRNIDGLLLKNQKIMIDGVFGPTHITAQELTTLRFWLQGLTHKEIAQALSLSSRTVETYLMRLKLRTGYTTKTHLHNMLSTCPL